MSRDLRLYLEDVRDSANKVLRYTAGMTFDTFINNELAFDAVVRNLEIIGEAAKHIPDAVRERYPLIPWRQIAGLRDVVAHAYFGIDEHLVWDIVENHVPNLVTQVQIILESSSDP